jgi:hypothetical protein
LPLLSPQHLRFQLSVFSLSAFAFCVLFAPGGCQKAGEVGLSEALFDDRVLLIKASEALKNVSAAPRRPSS